VAPLLQAFGILGTPAPGADTAAPATSPLPQAPPPSPVPEAEQAQDREPAALEAGWEGEDMDAALASDPRVGLSDPLQGPRPGQKLPMDTPERRVDSVYRSHLDSKRRDIQKLQSTLAQRVLETITQNEEFGVLLEVVLGELHQVSDADELEELRWTLIREIEKLNKGHHELADKLDSTHHYLQLIESDSRQLSDELTRVRLLSLTDELTGLPNRRAFLRRLEDEVARVQRYGFPLSLSLIDLDYFKQVNDRYGHAAGDEVLSIYSKNILSIFRHHDLVARYGGEEFAVLLPNTDAEGSQRALNKVKKRAAETGWRVDGKMLPVPTFSAGVSLYKPGETVGSFIDRADKALYRAKRLGRNRVELDVVYPAESETIEKAADTGAEDTQGADES
jgi:diguanylate cyclase (GGDEF)-like protein